MYIYELRGHKVMCDGRASFFTPREVAEQFAKGHYRVAYFGGNAHPLPPLTAVEVQAEEQRLAWENYHKAQREAYNRPLPAPVVDSGTLLEAVVLGVFGLTMLVSLVAAVASAAAPRA